MTHRIRRFLAGAAASSALAAAVVAVAAAPAQAEPSADCHTGTTPTSGTSHCTAYDVPAGRTAVHVGTVECFGLTPRAIPGPGGVSHIPWIQGYRRDGLWVPTGTPSTGSCVGGIGAPWWEVGVSTGAFTTCGLKEGIVTYVSVGCNPIRPQ
ncbi:hypothetical protein [Rhodococcus sp. ACPA1]|uniref:hypothetical protein n=1 Tax=Rhodococcus sp. ACPA1 TaxID=2028572 RepID=UPI000BB10BD0|nr:hypothetical protein [Rhodococcus sp. ACPA1]PBC58929.1 hypothetical protein CJ177_03615 [Rhodococcus sp. ACPA1]